MTLQKYNIYYENNDVYKIKEYSRILIVRVQCGVDKLYNGFCLFCIEAFDLIYIYGALWISGK